MSERFVKSQVIKGISYFEGTIDGKTLATGSAFIESEMDESNGMTKGTRTVMFPATSSAVIKAVFDQTYPMQAEVHYLLKVSKGKHEMIIENIKPLRAAGPNPTVAKG